MLIISFRSWPASQGKRERVILPQNPPAEEYEKGVEWRGWTVDMPSWWQELVGIPEVNDFQELAQKIQASFKLPQRMSEIHNVESYYMTPLAPKCLHWKDFPSPPDSKFPCQNIREEQLEKTMAYVQALQYWAEKSKLPMPG